MIALLYDVVIAGAGVIGGMLARALSRYDLSVCLLEKENDVACGASKANSGIVHGGFDPVPGTLKAKLNAEGVPMLFRAAEELHVPHRHNGSMVCAFGADEEPALRALYARGLQNGIPGLTLLSGDEARALEPALSPEITLVLRSETAGIICPYELTIAAVGCAIENGVTLRRNFEITAISHGEDGFTVRSVTGEAVQGRYLVNCAGCGSDRVAALAGDGFFKILPRAGEYLLLDKSEGSRVGHTIFQVPSAAGKGILVTPTVDGNLLTGPTASAVASADCTGTTAEGLQKVTELARKSVPSVDFRQVITSFTGVRSSEQSGDFILRISEAVPHLIHAAAIDSPGLTCSAAIAEYVTALLRQDGLRLEPKADWNGGREDPHAFRHMTDREKNAVIARDPAYGRIVCRCETVSEGELRDAIRREPVPLDLDGVKRRTRSGMGRCQGGFCSPRVMQLLSEELGVPTEAVTKNGHGSVTVTGRL